MYILGISGGVRLGYHDIGAALLKDGKLVAAVEEERINRVKHSPGQLPQQSIRTVLDIENITIRDIDILASHGTTWGEVYDKILKNYFEGEFGFCPPIERVHHHDAHAATALDAYNCNFQGRFLFETDEDKSRASDMGITDLKRKYDLNEIVSGDSIFCATGITSGDLVPGIKIEDNKFTSETFVTHKSSGLKKVIKLKQNI